MSKIGQLVLEGEGALPAYAVRELKQLVAVVPPTPAPLCAKKAVPTTLFTFFFDGEASCVGTHEVISKIARGCCDFAKVMVRRSTMAEAVDLPHVDGMAHLDVMAPWLAVEIEHANVDAAAISLCNLMAQVNRAEAIYRAEVEDSAAVYSA